MEQTIKKGGGAATFRHCGESTVKVIRKGDCKVITGAKHWGKKDEEN
jgi:hypothetical protein